MKYFDKVTGILMNKKDDLSLEEKLNSQANAGNPENLDKLEAAIENEIDHLHLSLRDRVALEDDFSEFDDDDDDWGFFEKRKNRQKLEEGKADGSDAYDDDTDDSEADESDAYDDDTDDSDEDEFDELDDVRYMQSAAYRKKTLTYEQREARRRKRIEFFWNFVDRRRKQIRWFFLGVLILLAAMLTVIISRNWKYHSVKELVYSDKEDTLSVSYANINGKVLKYGVDSAMLVDHNNDMLWTISYNMNAPKVTLCGGTFAIYDSKGTSICVCDETGQLGDISTDMPILKTVVSKQGVVAAILEDGQNAWIKTYSKDGSEIATLKTTFTNPGYPMDLGLSDDANLLAVDYLYIDNGTPVSRVAFYNFGTVGQNQKDNLVAETDYRDRILPEITYLDSKNCVVFREDGFSVFSGAQIPSESVRVEVAQSIVSTFHDSEYIGLVLQNRTSDNAYLISVYNMKGKEILSLETDFHYQTIEMNGGQIVLSSKDEFCVYSLQGVEKYRGSLEVPARVFTGFGRNEFIYVSEDVFRIIQIY